MKFIIAQWSLRRAAITGVIALMIVVLAGFASLPLAVSSGVVRDRLERDISAWVGHTISLGDAPSLDFWPTPTIKLDKVEIRPSTFVDGDPILRADSIIANFNLFSAVLGAPSFSEFKLIRPTFNVELYPDATSNWSSASGDLAQGISAAVARDLATQSGAEIPPDAVIPASAALGAVTIEDGTVRWIRDPGAQADKLTAINGTMAWTAPTAIARANITAIFRGEQVTFTGSTATPLLLLGGRSAPVDVKVTSAPLNLEFAGTANLGANFFLSGAIKLASVSARRALEWSGADIKPGEALGALDLSAKIITEPNRAKLDDLIIMVDKNRGIGVLDMTWRENEPPLIVGTLAFNSLDIASFLQAFTPLPEPGKDIATTIDTRFLREIGLDLRLSAQSARFGPVMLANLAAAARVEQGRANFDVGDATAYGGNLIGRIALSEKGTDGGLKVQLSARKTNLGDFYDAIGLTGPLPRGNGSLDLELTSPYPTWATALTDLTGRIDLNVGAGTVPGLNLQKFRELAKTERFFDLDQLGEGTHFAFKSAHLQATIADGEANLTVAELVGAQQMISLSGVIPYSRSSLAIAGSLRAKPVTNGEKAAVAANPAHVPLRFFIGGSWPRPVISPVTP
ncbi:AsmA-like C-terminal region-containing protein [Hoeflea sp. YIM 152468]|uniref:AsmA family protein n=1 Tax=Hoeflea sp. YIM 152468 TaxID=3031759 RepID=UPI0023DC42D6|nr:AsmA-like C-terminal region-containing protein [Hoeflea sp. YIM 152468]MDF1606598.1 AsmA-like C-terminal region-containing protein [Hoeflea sp. YIM 152468]